MRFCTTHRPICTLVDALIIEKVDGEWPEWAVKAISYHEWELDALYEAAKETP